MYIYIYIYIYIYKYVKYISIYYMYLLLLYVIYIYIYIIYIYTIGTLMFLLTGNILLYITLKKYTLKRSFYMLIVYVINLL